MQNTLSILPRGTTPTIRFRFRKVPVEDITEAYLTVCQGRVIAELDISAATAGEDTLGWRLTQEETLAIRPDEPVEIQCRWKTGNNTAGASRVFTLLGYKILKDGEI